MNTFNFIDINTTYVIITIDYNRYEAYIMKSAINKTTNNNNAQKPKNIFDYIIACCMVVLLISTTLIANDIIPRVQAKKEYEDLQVFSPVTSLQANSDEKDKAPTFDDLKEINPEYLGWINIKDTEIDFPVVQTTDNDYYLNVSFRDNYNDAGAIFVDYENSADFSDQNTVIYGHMRLDGTMFAPLKHYTDQEHYEKHPFITMTFDEHTYYYQIFSVKAFEATDDYRSPDYGDNFPNFIDGLRSYSYINSSADVGISDKILTLSTCTDIIKDGRLAIFAVLLNPDGSEINLDNYPI